MTTPNIPPKGTSNITTLVTIVPHGWDFLCKIRSLKREGSDGLPERLRPFVVVWTDISQILLDAEYDLHEALDNMPEREELT